MELRKNLFERATESAEDVNIWQEPSTWDNVYLKSNCLHATSLNKIVLLFCQKSEFITFICFVLESFCPPNVFLDKIIQLYTPPSKNEGYFSAQRKILAGLRYFARKRQDLFPPNGRLTSTLLSWLDTTVANDGHAKQVELIKMQLESISKTKDKFFMPDNERVPEPKIPKNIFSPKLQAVHVDPEELARQITLIHRDSLIQLSVSSLFLLWCKLSFNFHSLKL